MVARPDFGDKEGVKTLIKNASHGVNTSEGKSCEPLVDILKKMGVYPTRHDNNAWIKSREDGNDYAGMNVDDSIVIAKYSASHARKIKETFNVRRRN